MMRFKYKFKIIVLSLFVFLNTTVYGQFLSKQEAVELTLKNNYDINIINNNAKITENNASLKNNNYLPSLTGNAGANYNNNDIDVTFNDGRTTALNGAESESYNASLNLSYVLFDGFGRYFSYKKLQETHNLTELQAQATIENTLLELFNSYYQVAQLTENKNSLTYALQISNQRLNRIKTQAEYGQVSSLELLNAEVDANNDSINLLTVLQQLQNEKHNLNLILGREITTEFNVDTTVNFLVLLDKQELLAALTKKNVQLLQSEKNLELAALDININKINYIPVVGLNSAYGWNKNDNNSASFVQTQTSTGFSGGLTLTWSLFDGGKTSVQYQNAKITLQNQQLSKNKVEQELKRNFENTWGDYNNKLYILSVQEKNLNTTQLNFKKTEEQFKLGQITSIEFRQAQLNLINASLNRNNAKYAAKISELQLMQLSGKLLEMKF